MTKGESRSPSFPDWVEPMAATLTQERFTAAEWIFERKLDGIRLLAFKNGADIRLLSRNRLPQHVPAAAAAIAALPAHDAVLDGELTWHDRGVAYHVSTSCGWMAATSPPCRSTRGAHASP